MIPGPRGAACVISCLAVAAVAAPAAGQAMGDEEFVEREVGRQDESYVLVSFRGQTYRRVELPDLRGLSVGATQLPGLRVAVEGKFEQVVAAEPARVFRLMGSDRQFALADRSLIDGLVSGDNVWVGGLAQQLPGEASCFVVVKAVVRLKEDADLFNERCARYAKERNWQKLLALGKWIEASGKLVRSTIVADVDLYDSLKDRAFRQALRVREQTLAPDDPAARYEVAKMYREALGAAGDLKAADHLRRVLELDPGHKEAAAMLEGMGYVLYKDRWMTPLARAEMMRKEREELEAARAEVMPETGGPATGTEGAPTEALDTVGRMRRLLEVERSARSGPEALLVLAAGLPEEDDAVARRLVWILANAGGAAGFEGLVKGLQSRSADVRRDVADALAWCGLVQDLAGMVRAERKAEVRSHAVSALGSVRTREGIDALVDLLSVEDAATRSKVSKELAAATDQQLTDPDAWRRWWDDNRDAFEERAAP